jgi:hypothetical protein
MGSCSWVNVQIYVKKETSVKNVNRVSRRFKGPDNFYAFFLFGIGTVT